jgi:histidinol phosphatase-like enzyme
MIIYVDIDETICITPEDRNYAKSIPIKQNIEKINKLYDDGNNIVYWTARGTLTGINWEQITKKQLSDWNVKYHSIKFGKPAYDLFICDKAVNSLIFFKSED